MSVVGIDLGSDFSKVAVAYRKKIEVVPNELTKLLTPSLSAFTAKERSFGDAALTQWSRNYKNTVPQLKRWLGRKYDDETIKDEANFWLSVPTTKLDDGRFGFQLQTSQGDIQLAPEQVIAGFLGQLKKFTSSYLEGMKVTDCVIACPTYFDDAQRRALLCAAKLSELKVLRLLEETTAVALNYGILRNLPENETQRVIFVDIGFCGTQVAICDFIKGKLTVVYKSANPFIGARDFDRVLYNHFAKKWQSKYNQNINDFPKARLKLQRAMKKIKKQLTGNKESHWTLDSFLDDRDFALNINRDLFEERARDAGLYAKLVEPIIEAIEATKGDKIKIHSVEVVGGGSRIKSVQSCILEAVKKHAEHIETLSFTLNGDESVARGCALMCAMLSPNFRVREFQVQDTLTWPITISYPSDKQENDNKIIEQVIMQRGDPSPCTAKVMFHKTQNFVFKLQHPVQYKKKDTTVSITYPFNTNLEIGEFNVQLLKLSENLVQPAKIKILLDVNKQGLLDWPKASLIEYVKREPKPEPVVEAKKEDEKKNDDKTTENADKDKKESTTNEDKKTDDKKDKKDDDDDTTMADETNKNNDDKVNDTNTTNKDDGNMDVDDESASTTPKNEEEEKKDNKGTDSANTTDADDETKNEEKTDKKKKREKKKISRDLLITGNFFNARKTQVYNAYFDLEANMINVDRIVHETHEAKNDLETIIYAIRDNLEDSHREYIEEKKRETLSKTLTDMEDWVYDEGEDANKTQFLERLKQLKDSHDPVESRKWEFEHREGRVTQFKKLVFKYQQFFDNKDEKYAHIEEPQRKEIRQFANDADAWLTNQLIKQDKLKKYEAPAVRCKQIDSKYRELYNKCQPIMNTPKPPPPKPKEEEKKDDDKNKENNKDGDNKDNKTEANGDNSKKNDDDGDVQMNGDDKQKKDENVDANNDQNTESAPTTDAGVDGMQMD